MVSMPPSGSATPDEIFFRWIIIFHIWLFMVISSYFLARKKFDDESQDWVKKIPKITGILGICSIILSVLMAIFVIPEGQMGRWDESLNEQYTTLSILVYYKPMMLTIYFGITAACFGGLILGAKIWQSYESSNNTSRNIVIGMLLIWLIVLLNHSFWTQSTLIFSRGYDRPLHINTGYIAFTAAALGPLIGAITCKIMGDDCQISKTSHNKLLGGAILIVFLALWYLLAYDYDWVNSEGQLAISEHVLICCELVWLAFAGKELETNEIEDEEG